MSDAEAARRASVSLHRSDVVAGPRAVRGQVREVRAMLPPSRDGRRLADALGEFVERMRSGEIRPKRRVGYKPGTVPPTIAR